jgi:hypothetical protein
MSQTQQFAVEPYHPKVLVIFDGERPTPATHAFMMDDLGVGDEQDFPVSSPSAQAPIKVFAVEEISFIERPYIRNHLPAHHHASAGNCLDLDWPFRERILVQEEIGESERKEPVQPRRSSGSRKDERWHRQLPSPPGLLRAVSIKQKRTYHPDPIGRPQGSTQAVDGTLHHIGVGVEQKHIFGSRPHKSDIAGGSEAEVCWIVDDS